MRSRISDVAENLDKHRKSAIERAQVITMTGMYNVIAKLRGGEALTPDERKIHEVGACGLLKDRHDELDALVAEAYGWEWPLDRDIILDRLVALHDQRVEEENAGNVRWLRPDYQIPRLGKDLPAAGLGLVEAVPKAPKKTKRSAWPPDVISQIGAVKRLLASEALTATELAACFKGAKVEIVGQLLEILDVIGEAQVNPDGRYEAVSENAGAG